MCNLNVVAGLVGCLNRFKDNHDKSLSHGVIANVVGKGVYSYDNPWWNPFAEDNCTEEDKPSFDEFVRGWNEADSDRNGMVDVLKLARQ